MKRLVFAARCVVHFTVTAKLAECNMFDDESQVRRTDQSCRKVRSRQKFVTCFLIFHLLFAIWTFRFGGHAGALSWFAGNYFVFTSIPTIVIVPFLSDSIRSNIAVFMCLLINGVINAWLFSVGLHYIFYRKQYRYENVNQ